MTNFGLNNLAALLSHPLNYPIYIQLLTSSLHKFFFFLHSVTNLTASVACMISGCRVAACSWTGRFSPLHSVFERAAWPPAASSKSAPETSHSADYRDAGSLCSHQQSGPSACRGRCSPHLQPSSKESLINEELINDDKVCNMNVFCFFFLNKNI